MSYKCRALPHHHPKGRWPYWKTTIMYKDMALLAQLGLPRCKGPFFLHKTTPKGWFCMDNPILGVPTRLAPNILAPSPPPPPDQPV